MARSAHPAGSRHADGQRGAERSDAPVDVTALDPLVWPVTAERVNGRLTLGGASVVDLVSQFGTPLMLMDEQDLRERARQFVEAFAGNEVYYAGKAFLCTQLARWIAEDGLGLDVCTAGEMAVALAADFPPERMALHGNNKSVAELTSAVHAGVGTVVIDSFEEIERLSTLCDAGGVRQRVMVRVTVGVEAHTHEYIATAHEDQKFGFSLASGDAFRAIGQILASGSLDLIGLHSHIGSQIFDTAGFEVSARRIVGLLAQIRDEHGVELPVIDLGGGFGIAYRDGDEPQAPKEIAGRLRSIVEQDCAEQSLALPLIAVEPGRAIVGPSTVTVYEVGTVKPVEVDGGTVRTYVSVDGGMSDNIRTALYGADYTVALVNRVSAAPAARVRIVGKHCESGDIVVRDAWLPGDIEAGDLIAVAATGAYCRSMASNYNFVTRPPVVAVRNGETQVMVRRETIQDLLALDAGVHE
ncbi:MAG: diaminopimelate decarboxylase [Jatrophihabitans sp.]